MPKEAGPAFIRQVWSWGVSGGAAAVAPDFAANTLATIWGGAGGFTFGFVVYIEKLLFTVGNADFVGGGGTLTFELRKSSATGTALAQLVVPLASALRGVTLSAAVSAANDNIARIKDTDTLFLVRLATGTAFTTGEGTWGIQYRQKPQARF